MKKKDIKPIVYILPLRHGRKFMWKVNALQRVPVLLTDILTVHPINNKEDNLVLLDLLEIILQERQDGTYIPPHEKEDHPLVQTREVSISIGEGRCLPNCWADIVFSKNESPYWIEDSKKQIDQTRLGLKGE